MITIRMATKEDYEFYYEIKSEDENIFWTGWDSKPEKEKLRHFFYNTIDKINEKSTRKIYIIEDGVRKIGYLYILPNGEEYELPCAIMSQACHKGYGKRAIQLGLKEGKRLGFKRMVTSIREDNIASLKAYTSCGIRVLDDYKEVFIPRLNKNVKMYYVVYDYEDTNPSEG